MNTWAWDNNAIVLSVLTFFVLLGIGFQTGAISIDINPKGNILESLVLSFICTAAILHMVFSLRLIIEIFQKR